MVRPFPSTLLLNMTPPRDSNNKRTHTAMRTQPANSPSTKPLSWALQRKRRFQQRRVLDSLRQHGVIEPGVRAAGVSPRIVQRWLGSDPSVAGRYQEALLTFRDLIKERLLDRAHAGDGATLRFVASHLIPEEFGSPAVRRALQAQEALRDPWTAWEEAHGQAHLNK